MKIEDAIKRYELWAEDDRIDVRIRKEHRQMADWLKELKAERPQGEWTNAGVLTVHCSNCKSEFHELEAMNYCPHCGARMKGADDD